MHMYANLFSWAYAALVPHTNMVLLITRTDGEQCANGELENGKRDLHKTQYYQLTADCLGTGRKVKESDTIGVQFQKVDYIFQEISNASDKASRDANRLRIKEVSELATVCVVVKIVHH